MLTSRAINVPSSQSVLLIPHRQSHSSDAKPGTLWGGGVTGGGQGLGRLSHILLHRVPAVSLGQVSKYLYASFSSVSKGTFILFNPRGVVREK